MSKRKNQNSILVLATLGVYLGLVLVGATPQVLAQAAMARQFNVKDEIEVKDDLDKKPGEDSDPFAATLQIYVRDLENYLNDVSAADRKLKSIYSSQAEYVIFSPCRKIGNINRPVETEITGYGSLPILLNPIYADLDWGTWRLGCTPFNARDKHSGFADVELEAYNGQLSYELGVSPSLSSGAASDLCDRFIQAYERIDPELFSAQQKVLWDRTKIVVKDNAVFLVTCLPRGSLDALLASNAK